MLKRSRFHAGAGPFAVTCERELIVQSAPKDGEFFYGQNPGASGTAASAEAKRESDMTASFLPAHACCRGDFLYD
jgi:hypothetical protein